MKIGHRYGKGDDKAFYVSIKNDIYERISNIVTQTKDTERCYSIHPLPSTPDFQACLININIRISYAKTKFIFWWMSYSCKVRMDSKRVGLYGMLDTVFLTFKQKEGRGLH